MLLEHFDVFALFMQASSFRDLVIRRIGRKVTGDFFGQNSRAAEKLEHFAQIMKPIPELFLGFAEDALFGCLSLEPAGAGFDQRLAITVEPSRQAELARQQDGSTRRI